MNEKTELSKREIQVVRLLMDGKSNKQIANKLGISEGTVEFHLTHIYAKLGVGSRVEAILHLGQAGTSLEGQPTQPGETRGTENVQLEETPGTSTPEHGYDGKKSSHHGKGNEMNGKNASPSIVKGLIFLGLALGLIIALVIFFYLSERELTVNVTPAVTLQVPRTWHTANQMNDQRILLTGGSNGADEQYALVEIYDPASGRLTPAANLNTARHEHSATTLLDGRVLVVGGYNYQDQWLEDAEIYDPAMNTWTVVAPIYSHGVQHTATLMADGRVLVIGGCIASGVCTERVEIFDPAVNAWRETTPLATYRASHTAILLNDGRVLVAGGAGPYGNPQDGDALMYDPASETWETTGAMPWKVQQAQAVKLLDGRVLVAGGLTNSENPMASANCAIYNPATNEWSAVAALAQPRFANLLVLLPKGQVMAVGGAKEYDYPQNHPGGSPWTISSFVREIEIYDPKLDAWHVGGEMPQPVTYAAAAWLPDGRLWVTGGGAGHAVATAWAETWMIRINRFLPDLFKKGILK
jgi:DNA-binding CsgD family transcriptional regulator/N-acetylneuraminic acid mutarotase